MGLGQTTSPIHAACRLNQGAAVDAALEINNGFETAGAGIPVDNGVGDWTISFSQQIDPDECMVFCNVRAAAISGAGGQRVAYVTVTDTTLRIRVGDGTDAGAVARDEILDICVIRIRG